MQSVYNFQFSSRKQRRSFVIAITLIALLLFMWVFCNGIYRIYDTYKDRKASEQSTVVIDRAIIKPEYSISTVIKTKLFGEQKKKVIAKRQEKAPETKLDLAIQGLLSANKEGLARAIISVKKKTGGLYKVGDEIKDANATLEEIREDGVLLNRNGIIENLAFIKKTISGNRSVTNFSPINPPNNPASYNRAPDAAVNRSRSASNSGTPSGNSQRRTIKRPNFKGLDQAIERELEAALDDLEKN